MPRLEGKIAIVTGANSGIGLATARTLLAEGAARVYVTGRRKVELDKAVGALGARAAASSTSQPRSRRSRVSGVKTRWRRLSRSWRRTRAAS